jgi:rare lipoprotein A
MARWLVILGLAMTQCLDVAAAEPQASDIPVPRGRPARGPRAPRAAVTPRRPGLSDEPAVEEGAAEDPDHPAVQAAPPAPAKTRTTGGGCSDGKKVVSTYYWEGRRTASGERFDPHGMTAAHRTLPFGTKLTVSNPSTGKSVIVVINDRGPFVSGVGLDLSLGAAQALGMRGTGAVCIQ